VVGIGGSAYPAPIFGLHGGAGGVFFGGGSVGCPNSVCTRGGNGIEATPAPNGDWAGLFFGHVRTTGNLSVGGTLSKAAGSFKIDHPLEPKTKYLSHSFVESPDMMNIYNGVVVLDGEGTATITLPEWFQALNRDFRYQLTAIGGFAPVYVSAEVGNNQFAIAGGKPGMKISWQVTGIRQDSYANANRIPVEELKPMDKIGTLEWAPAPPATVSVK
jgi:hypothetical protein